MTVELRALLDRQRAITENLQRRLGVVCQYVFHREGKRIKAEDRSIAIPSCPSRSVACRGDYCTIYCTVEGAGNSAVWLIWVAVNQATVGRLG